MQNRQITAISISVVFGMILVAGSLFTKNIVGLEAVNATAQRADSSARHMYGNPDAETIIVEFSDYECPFCAQLHPTLKKIVDESKGAIAWEYRHLPLPSHPHARIAATYAECIATLGTADMFWDYSDILFSNQRAISEPYLQQQALVLGVEEQKLATCVQSETVALQIEKDMQTAQTFGGTGTPFNVIIFPDGVHKPVSGAVPYAQWSSVLNL